MGWGRGVHRLLSLLLPTRREKVMPREVKIISEDGRLSATHKDGDEFIHLSLRVREPDGRDGWNEVERTVLTPIPFIKEVYEEFVGAPRAYPVTTKPFGTWPPQPPGDEDEAQVLEGGDYGGDLPPDFPRPRRGE